MNNKVKPFIIDNEFINLNIDSNKYIINNININNNIIARPSFSHNRKIKSKSPAILRFYNYKDFEKGKKENNKMNTISSNGLRLKTDYNNHKNSIDIIDPNLKTLQNILYNKDRIKYKFNNKLKFNNIYSFLH